jgi:hypothetical protein
MNMYSVLPSILMLVYLGLIGLGIYCMMLFIKLATRGIKALDIFIDRETRL